MRRRAATSERTQAPSTGRRAEVGEVRGALCQRIAPPGAAACAAALLVAAAWWAAGRENLAVDRRRTTTAEPPCMAASRSVAGQCPSAGSAATDFDAELSQLADSLWANDTNRCEPGIHYKINKQGRIYDTRSTNRDAAPDRLFSSVNEEEVFKIPTFYWLKRLLDNYELSTGEPEVVTEEELKENDEFLNAVLSTKVMQLAHEYLVKIGKSPADKAAFKRQLNEIWFKLYKRNRADTAFNSCGFEHVFVGETRGADVIGLHNWISFYLLEKAGTINYNGYIGRADQKKPRLLSVQFTFKGGQGKPAGGSFIGVSPEFEFALYTACFLANHGHQLKLRFADMEVEVTVHSLGRGIGTAYATDISGRR